MAQLMPSIKSVKVNLVTFGIEKLEKKVNDFLFFPSAVHRTAPDVAGSDEYSEPKKI